WPLARGAQPLPAAQGGDAVVAQRWRGLGVHERLGAIREAHPWTRGVVNYGWPNPASVQRIHKLKGKVSRLIGVLPRRAWPLHAGSYLEPRGTPGPRAGVAGGVADALFAAWSAMVLQRSTRAQLEPIRQFDCSFDALTQRCMQWAGYWSPHD